MDKSVLKKWFNELLEDIRVVYCKYSISGLYFLPASFIRIFYFLCVLVVVRENPFKELERGDVIAMFSIVFGIVIYANAWIISYLIWWNACHWLGMTTEV